MSRDDLLNPFSGHQLDQPPPSRKRAGPPLSEDGMPILSLKLEGMRLNLHQALLSQQQEISEIVQAELDRTCNPAALKELVDGQVRTAVRERIAKEIDYFFNYGDGADVIGEAVNLQLAENLKGVFENVAKRYKK